MSSQGVHEEINFMNKGILRWIFREEIWEKRKSIPTFQRIKFELKQNSSKKTHLKACTKIKLVKSWSSTKAFRTFSLNSFFSPK